MSEGARVLVCGGRDYANIERVFYALDQYHKRHGPISLVITGAARGADTLAGAWALARRVDLDPYPADWRTHGKRAGPLRNQQMIDEGKPTVVIAFPGGAGTADMVRRAKAAGITTHVLPV